MAPSPITEDYYMILEVQQDATPDQITKSYRRLALKLHPDRNAEAGSTQAFQLLGQAYETLNDEVKRRAYDIIYPSIQRSNAKTQSTQTETPGPPPPSAPYSEIPDLFAQIAALRIAKEERIAKWITTRSVLESPIFDLQRSIQWVKQELERLARTEAYETDLESREGSWASNYRSPQTQHLYDNEEEKTRRDRARQERMIEKDLRERRLDRFQRELLNRQNQIDEAKKCIDAQNLRDDQAIESILLRLRSRGPRERRDTGHGEQKRPAESPREQEEHDKWKRRAFEMLLREQEEKMAELRREQEGQAEQSRKKKEEFEMLLREQQERLAKLQREQDELRERAVAEAIAREAAVRQEEARQEEFERSQRRWRDDQQSNLNSNSARQAHPPTCDHDIWWHQIYQRAICPKCFEERRYLLQCPGCQTQACPGCRSELREKLQRQQERES